jgi:hypothetical protein
MGQAGCTYTGKAGGAMRTETTTCEYVFGVKAMQNMTAKTMNIFFIYFEVDYIML